MLSAALILLFTGGSEGFFKFYHEGASASLECTADKGEVQYWFLHGKGPAIDRNFVNANINLNVNGSLHFQNVSKNAHEGHHVCVVKYLDTLEAHSVDMEVEPLPPTNLWEYQYKRMLVTAVISALICLLLFVGFCLVKQYRWREPLAKVSIQNERSTSYVNPAIDDTDECSIRM